MSSSAAATYASTLQRRKSAKGNNNKSTTITTTTTTTATVKAEPLDISSAAQNERLQRQAASEKLEALRRKTQQQQAGQFNATGAAVAAATTTTATTKGAATLCNGIGLTARFVNCCRDVNCRLNTPSGAAAARLLQQQKQQQQQQQNGQQTENRRSASVCLSGAAAGIDDDAAEQRQRRSISRATASSSRSSAATSFGNAQPTDSDLSDDDDNSTDAGRDDAALAALWTRASVLRDAQWTLQLRVDLCSWLLLLLACGTRFYRLAQPAHVVFDELHYGKYVSFYMRGIFFFDQHPPLGKQLIAAAAAYAGGYDGNYTFPHIGAAYTANVPVFWLRFVPALCGSLLAPAVYRLLLEARLRRGTALLGGLLIVFDNALLTQSRFILMEPILLLFTTLALCCLLRFQRSRFGSAPWLGFGVAAAAGFACATSVKYVGFFSGCLAAYLLCRHLWRLLYDARVSDFQIVVQACSRLLLFSAVPAAIYLGIFYVHLGTLQRAGPHDSVMTSAFQASLDGGLASITRSQPLRVAHGSQITLRHTHGRPCWLHSHAHVYPVRYPDKRGSSHQQQVTCYAFKDVNNWWIVKRPDREELIVDDEPDVIKDGDVVQLVHGITSRALNSHDVAAPMSPQCQEVSCYIDYDIKMAGELLWRVQILNKEAEGPVWHAIRSEVRFIHESTGAALRFSAKLLPDWGFNQNEVVADRAVDNSDAAWNVEEHRYTKTQDKRERERQLLSAEMIPTQQTQLSFWEKFLELQAKMLWHSKHVQAHMYSSEPLEWPLLDKGIAYWVDRKTNSQIHLLGNVLLWYTATLAVLAYAALAIFYVVRRRRLCCDLTPAQWQRFLAAGDIFFAGYLFHYLPYFFVERTLFLHHYLPALLFKLLLLCYMLEHCDDLLRRRCDSAGRRRRWPVRLFRIAVLLWLCAVVAVFVRFLPLSYGFGQLNAQQIGRLRWKDTWDFIVQKTPIVANN